MNILLIGSGGREHALAWKLAQSPQCDTLFCAPGNPGIAKHAKCINLKTDDHGAVIDFCAANDIAYVVVGPEAPLVAGLVDALAEAGIDAFGPSAAAARLEGSKGFTKDLCAQYNIPTARYRRFDNARDARAFLGELGLPAVVKADGLAAGKGVTIAQTRQEAEAAIEACFDGSFGKAGHEVVLEAFLEGEEASLFAICDGQTALLMGTAQDHKRAYDGDQGPNTGGMGAYSPAPVMSQELIDQTMSDIIVPTLAGMAARGTPFKGVLYAGLMITEKGPELIEYNVRFGDPECQVLMTRLKSDLLELMQASTNGAMLEVEADWHDEAAMTIVMAANGYPGNYEKGSAIRNIGQAEADGTLVFHAGTRMGENGIEANGGRVLNITALGKTVTDARNTAYAAIDTIDWSDGFYRKDIGWRAIERENT